MFNNFFKWLHYCYIILIIKICYCELSIHVNQKFFANTTAVNFFRFRDFEPRSALKTESLRKPRGFQFRTDNQDFNVDLEFIVPFIRIPIERSMTATQTAFRNLLNLNSQSILTTGAIVAIGGIFAIVLKIIFTQYAFNSNYRKSFRTSDFTTQNNHIVYSQIYGDGGDSEFILPFNKFVTLMETKLQQNSINISQCIQSSLCSYAQESFYGAKKARGDGLPRILSGISSLGFVQDYLNGTSIKNALDAAKSGDSCSKAFNNCNLPFSLNLLLKMFLQNTFFLNII